MRNMDVGTLALIGTLIGLAVGLVPLVSGYFKNRLTLGVIGLIACGISGAILGFLLAVPVAAAFTIAIFATANRRRRHEPTPA